ncbi:MAG TPA: NADP-dependent malic enzyme [Acidobacteriota bacterium]|nr:NADP-dependent malic enzyme [Acidobacteriota bacterium]
MIRDEEALSYHAVPRPGKIEVTPTKPCLTQRDLSLAYTPGVAVPCRHIQRDVEKAYTYTAKGNLVAVVSNGTAVLGLGNIGALAGKPVMEGKGVLFKRFADIDVFDLEIDSTDPQDVIRTVKLLEPTFGGINLEDIRAPECFLIEDRLKELLQIPVFHDDQHGTAIISGAALLNALEIVGKDVSDVKVVFNGAGASGIACAKYYLRLGVRPENLILCDSKGVIYRGRTEGMNPWKEQLASDTEARTLAEALRGADVFVGLSVGNCLTGEMLRTMSDRPVVFALANPDPEITYEEAKAARPDVIMATGRSDYPNQVNNVLGFPFIFRGALDVRATAINEEMKLAATKALASLAKEDVPESVAKAYGLERLRFGSDYLIPKPFDPRVLIWESAAVAEAAMKTGVARRPIDLDRYREELEQRLSPSREVMRVMINQARRDPKKVVFPEGEHPKVLRACQAILEERIAVPILLGAEARVRELAHEYALHLDGVQIVDPQESPLAARYAQELYQLRQRKGITLAEAQRLMRDNPNVYGAMMVRLGDADALVAGVGQHYPDTLRPALQIIQVREDCSRVVGLFLMVFRDRLLFFADTTVNIEPSAEELADIAILTAQVARRFNVDPRVAMLSFSNFGSVRHPLTEKVRRATELVRQKAPGLAVDGEMQADTAVFYDLIREHYPFSTLTQPANILIFPDLQSANIAYKLVQRLGGAETVGPILVGMRKPVHVLQYGFEAKDIVNMTAIAVVEAQEAIHPGPRQSF